MIDDDETATATRPRTRRSSNRPDAEKRVGRDKRLVSTYSDDGEHSFDAMGNRIAAKTKDLQKRILETLAKRPLSIPELAKAIPYQLPGSGLKHNMRLLMHTEQVRAFIEIPREKIERLAFVRAEDAPSGLWDRQTLPGFQCFNPRAVGGGAGKASARRQRAVELLDRAAALPKRQEALALEMTKVAMAVILDEDGD